MSQHLNKRALPTAPLSQVQTAAYTNSPWQRPGAAPLPGTQPGPALCPASCLSVSCAGPLLSPHVFLKHRALLLPPLTSSNHNRHLLEISLRLYSSEPPHCPCCPSSIHHSICSSPAAPVFQLGNHVQNQSIKYCLESIKVIPKTGTFQRDASKQAEGKDLPCRGLGGKSSSSKVSPDHDCWPRASLLECLLIK